MLKKILSPAILLVVIGAMGSSLTGCATYGADWAPVTSGIIVTPGVKIAAEDGSFVLASGKEFVPPIQTAALCYTLVGNQYGLTAANYKKALEDRVCNAKKVRITVPGRNEPLYGVLVMGKSDPRMSHEAASRSYRIQVPQEYVQQALDGRVSLVYEWGEVTWSGGDKSKWATWALWLSDKPLQQ